MLNFYHRFVPHVANLLRPLHNALKGKTKVLVWTKEMNDAFEASKSALATASLLVHPKHTAMTSITVDASSTAVGGALEQYINGQWQPLAFFSRNLKPAETRYSAFDRELLAMYLAVRHFRYFLEGRLFHIYTDHKPITFAFHNNADRSPRQTRHLSFIAEFTTDVRYIPGKTNVAADMLSRVHIEDELSSPSSPSTVNTVTFNDSIDYTDMARAQLDDRDVQTYKDNIATTALVLRDVELENGDTILCDVSTSTPRPIVPLSWRRRVFDAIHGTSHPSGRTTKRLMNSRYVWHGINKDITAWTKTCLACQRAKIHRHVSAPLQQFPTPDHRFDNIHVDIVGPLPSSQGTTYLFTIVDRFTRWPEAIPMADATAVSCARALLENWMPRFGVPTDIVSDRGRQFISGLWMELGKLLGMQLHHTTAYHAQSNGLVEQFYRQLKASLKARLHGPDWRDELPIVLLGIRCSIKEDLGCTSAELVYGTTLRLPGEFFETTKASTEVTTDALALLTRLRKTVRSLRAKSMTHHGRQHVSRIPTALLTCTFVFVRKDAHRTPLECPYEGPFRVLERNDKYYTLDIRGRRDTVSIDRLKPAFVDDDFDIATGPTIAVRCQREPNKPASVSVRTRSGRHIRSPDRL